MARYINESFYFFISLRMEFFINFLERLVFAVAFIVVNFLVFFLIGFFIVNKREDMVVNVDKSISITSIDYVISFRDLLIGVLGFGMVVFLLVQVVVYINNITQFVVI